MKNKPLEILVVEDKIPKREFEGIKEELKSDRNIDIHLAQTYTEFEKRLGKKLPNEVILDLEFNYEGDSRFMPVEKIKTYLDKYVQNYQKAREISESIRKESEEKNIPIKKELLGLPPKTLKKFVKLIEKGKHVALGGYGGLEIVTTPKEIEEYGGPHTAVDGYSRNFPFGIYAMEKLDEKGIPFRVWTEDNSHGYFGLIYATAKGLVDKEEFITLLKDSSTLLPSGFFTTPKPGEFYHTKNKYMCIGFKTIPHFKKLLDLAYCSK